MYDQTTIEPQPQASYPAPGAPAPRRRSKAPLFLLLGGVGVLAIIALVAGVVLFGRSKSVTFTAAGAQAPAATGTAPTSVAPGSPVDSAVDAASTLDAPATSAAPAAPATPKAPVAGNGSGATPNGGGTGGQPAPKGPAPVVTSFNTNGSVDCHNGNQQTFSYDWTTKNATSVTVAMDGATIQTVGPNGNGSLPFNCSSAHTYTLTAHGQNGQSATKSVTLQPRNVQKPPTNDDDAPSGPSTTFKPLGQH